MNKYCTTFQFDNMNLIDDFISSKSNTFFNYKDLKNLLSTENVSFVLSGINRLQSMLLCEEGFSYVQQSQRYVPMDFNFIRFIDNTPIELKVEGARLVNKSMDLYKEMTQLKDENKKGRPAIDDFIHSIPYEDARSILPINISTNIVVSNSADRLIDLFALFNKYPLVFESLRNEFEQLIPFKLYHALQMAAHNIIDNDTGISDNYFKNKYKLVSLNNPVILLNSTNNVAMAALASQSKESPDTVYNSWGSETEYNDIKICKNVLGYGHHGINEHSRNTFVMTCSLAAYHQVIRHRLQNNRREPLKNILIEKNREFVIPESILMNEYFFNKVNDLIEEYREFYNKFITKYDNQFLMQFMLNGHAIKFVACSNIRNDNNICRDRLCYTAQEEIRKLYLKKYKILHEMYPHLVKYGLPPCVTTKKCKEGKLTCGHMNEVYEEYKVFI